MKLPPTSVHLFCRVIDNYGDIGVCWRLARQLVHEHALNVTLWVDDLLSFQILCRDIDPTLHFQHIFGVAVKHWLDAFVQIPVIETADVVIEAFGCRLPKSYIAAMAVRVPVPVWLNLEYLSAETWIEGCHTMQSVHPSLPLIKYFFFPGFSNKTGGVLVERDLPAQRKKFQNDPKAIADFFDKLELNVPPNTAVISLFCYPSAPVENLFRALISGSRKVICIVPEGVAHEAVSTFLQQSARAGLAATQGVLTVHVLPFISQPEYDKLLWACDLNFVRGEDSFVRAQWAARPFIWHIYPQDEFAHMRKLDVFLDRYLVGVPDDAAKLQADIWHAWNGEEEDRRMFGSAWLAFRDALPKLEEHASLWADQLLQNGDLATNLLQFVRKIG